MTTTPPTAAEIDAWFDNWLSNNWPSSSAPLWGLTLTFVVCAWTLNNGSPTYMLLDPTGLAGNAVGTSFNQVPEPVWFSGVQQEYSVAVRVYQYTVTARPPASAIVAPDTVQAQYATPGNWQTPH